MTKVMPHVFDLPKPVIFTHGDADGLCAAAILMRSFEEKKIDYEVVITQPFSLQNDIVRYDVTDNFIIMDLAISNRVKNLLMPGTIVIDHHPSTAEFRRELEDRGVFVKVDLRKSASQLVYDEIKGGRFDRYLSRLGAAGDWVINNQALGKQAGVLASSMAWIPDDDWMRFYILASLVEGKKVWDMSEALHRSELAYKKLDLIRKEGNHITLHEDKNFVVRYYEDGFGFASALANRLYKEKKRTAFVVCLVDVRAPELLVTGRVPDNIDFDLRKVFKSFKYWGGYGGGHRKAASGILPKECIIDFCVSLQKMGQSKTFRGKD